MKKHLLALLFTAIIGVPSFAQRMNITGKVTDIDSDKGLPGVTIKVKNTSTGAITAPDGTFSINVPENALALEFTFIGYQQKKVPVNGRNVINVQLIKEDAALNEHVVVAYGTVKRESYTGAFSQLKAKAIEQRPISNIASALEGAAPGIQVNSTSGQPGSGPNIRIRGFGSINASSEPLYVVDGVPYSGSISNLNINDIESISLLKDASSAALYGARAANGVVMVTTKRGKSGRNNIQVKINQGWVSRAIPEYDRLDAFAYYPLMWEAYRNSLQYASGNPRSQEQASQIASGLVNGIKGIKDLLGYNPFNVADSAIVRPDGTLNPGAKLLYGDDLDWVKTLQRTGTRGDYGLGFNGGNERTDYYISLGYTNEKGFVEKSDFERYTGRVNINTRPKDWFKTGLNISGTLNTFNQLGGVGGTGYINPFFFSRNIGPIYPVYKHDVQTGEYLLDNNGNKIYDLGDKRGPGANPGRHVVAETRLNDRLDKSNVLSARTYGEISFLKNFKFTTNVSIDVSNKTSSIYENTLVGDGAPAGRIQKTNSTTTSYNLFELLNYHKTFNERHNLEVMLGHENYNFTYVYNSGARQGQVVEGNTEMPNFTTINNLDSRTDRYRTEGFFGRVNYDYSEKYFLSGSYRRDGSSRFYKDARWGSFWSLGAGWRLDNEPFIKDMGWINLLKLRTAYGEVGNDMLEDYYAWQSLYNLNYNNAGFPGVLQGPLPNHNLVWETNKSFDIALDFGCFDNRLSGSLEFFHRVSDNLLFSVPLPVSSGTESKYMNIGSMYNRGFEVQIDGMPVKNKNFSWRGNLNLTTFTNKVTRLPQEEIISGTKKLQAGHSRYDYWLRDWYGVDPNNGQALYWALNTKAGSAFVNKNGDTVTNDINNARYNYAGSAIPRLFGAVSNTLTYRDFSLSFTFSFQLGGKIYDGTYAALMDAGNYGAALHKDILKRWQQPGDITDVPRMDNGQRTNFNADNSDRWLTDASYLNFRTLTLTYNLPASYLRKMHMENARVYISGENLFMFTARKGMNPNQDFTGVTTNAYVPSRVISVGLNVTL